MPDLSESRDPLDALGEEFLDRLRRGERPEAEAFAARDPARAEEIREFLAALLFVEGLKPRADLTADASTLDASSEGPCLERIGDFRIVRELGRGGMGVVYEAEQESLGRRVALKVLAPGIARTSQQVRRFLREARAAARLHHTNIVPVFGVGEYDGLYYYAMQIIAGLGLDKVLEEVRRLKGRDDRRGFDALSSTRQGTCEAPSTPTDGEESPGPAEGPAAGPEDPDGPSLLAASADSEARYACAVARIGLQVAEALEYAHRQGTLHRDVKPSNILLDVRGVAWVTDFGLAKAAEDEDLTRTGDLVGTVRYMAPERFRGLCNASSDVYGLGLALFELLALRPAYDAPERERLLYQVSHVEPPRLRAINPALPRDLETIVHKSIEKDTAHRYRDAAELADDLRRFLEDRPIRARRVGSTERLTRWARRNPELATLGTALAGMLALVVVVIAAADLRLRRQNAETVFQLQRAEHAEADAVSKLLTSHLDHARASRRSRFAGRRGEGLKAIGQAARLAPSEAVRLELRDEAIACMALTDLSRLDPWPGRAEDGFVGVDFDPIAGRLARGAPDGTVVIRDAKGGKGSLKPPRPGHPSVFVRFSPDGRRLAVKQDERGQIQLTIWDVDRATPFLELAEGMYSDALDFHPDGETLATGRRDGSIVLHDLTARRPPRRLAPGTVPRMLRFDPTGRRLAIVSPISRSGIQVRQVSDGAVVAKWEFSERAFAVAWHPSGRWLAVGDEDGRIRVLDADDPGRPARTFEAHDGQVISLAYHPSGNLLASASWDGSLRLWDSSTGRELVRADLPDVRPIRFSRDGRQLGPGHDVDASWLWGVTMGEECRTLAGPDGQGTTTRSIGFLEPEGVLVSAGAAGVRLELAGDDPSSSFLSLPGTSDAAVAPDGSFLLTSGTAGVLRWPIRRPSPTGLSIGPPEAIRPLAGFPTGRIRLGRAGRILAVMVDNERGRVRMLDLQGEEPPVTLAGHGNAERLDLSPDGRWLATGTWQGTGVRIWDAHGAKLVRELPVRASADVVFSPDGTRLLTASGVEYSLWEAGTWGQLLSVARSQSGGLPGVGAFSPDGKSLAIARTRSTVQLVDAGTGRPLATLEAPEPRNVSGLGFSRDGQLLAAALNGPRILAWNLGSLRTGLSELGLDWPAAPATASSPSARRAPIRVVINSPPWLGHLESGETLARHGRRQEAATAFDAAIAAGAPHVSARARRALFIRTRGDEPAYRAACRELLASFDLDEVSPRAVNEIVWTCALGAGAVDDYEPLIRLARSITASRPEPNRLNTLGAVLFRAGRVSDAVQELERSVEAHGAGGTAYDAIFLAMAHQRLGRADEARRWLARGNSPPAAMFKPDAIGDTSWIPELELDLLRREAAEMIGPPHG